MDGLNLSTRIVMFAICTSLEYDLKNYIIACHTNIEFTEEMISKAQFRNTKVCLDNSIEILNQLDLGDFVKLLTENPCKYRTNNEKVKTLFDYFQKIIPIRNRVMHTKPLELGDRAVLSEVIQEIDEKIKWIDWNEAKLTRKALHEDPSVLIGKKFNKVIEFNPKVYHNLPEPEFDDTGYIGRKKEIKDIKELLQTKKYQIITIVGNGGIGKTAIAVKTLYDLIEDCNNDIEAIIWISLKTRTLSKGEFALIQNSIKSVSEMYSYGQKLVVIEKGLTPKENLLAFMKEFKVLLVLDNLETINNEDVNSFIKEIPESSKVLITSRHGIGELEYRYKLEGMNLKDSITYFRELSKYYALDLHKRNDNQIKALVEAKLYSNPLSIKWFISGIYNGMDEKALLANKDQLIEFCMSNVYNKLSEKSTRILQLFVIENKELSLGEIDYFLDSEAIELRQTINELLSTNMIKLKAGRYCINEMARDYLSIYHAPQNEFVLNILEKRKRLKNILQEIKVKNENDPFNPRSLFANLDSEDRKLSSFYLTKALEASSIRNWEKAFNFIDKAASISPDYFEIYKIKAFILAEKMDLFGAMTNYQTAIDNCYDNFEKATVLFLYSVFCVIKLSDYPKALELIVEAESYCPNEIIILLEKSRIIMYLGKYEEAEEILKGIESRREELNLRIENMFACRYADLLRRQSETFELRDVKKKLNYLKGAISKIEKVSKIDRKTYLIMAHVLKEIAFLYFDEEAMEFLRSVLDRHFSSLKSINHANLKRMADVLSSHQNEIPKNLYTSLKKYVYDYSNEASQIYNENQGVIVFVKDHFGFIANANNKSIYFNLNNLLDGAEVGDKVEFETYQSNQGLGAKNIKKINCLIGRYCLE